MGAGLTNNNTNPKQLSHYISDVCRMMDNASKDYDFSFREVERLDKLTQDYLHALELDGLDYGGRAKIATQLTKCRKLRRQHKDDVKLLEPLVSHLESERGKNFMNLLKEVLGKVRKSEEFMSNRKYRQKVLDSTEETKTKN